MHLLEASPVLAEMFARRQTVYLRTDPESPDFTDHAPFRLVLCCGHQSVALDVTRENVDVIIGLLDLTAFNADHVSALLTWNVKSLLSYFKQYVGKPVKITPPIFDLQVIENFLGVKNSAPGSLLEAVERTKKVSSYKNWKSIYSKLHLPLMTEVLPDLETCGVLDEADKCAKYTHYEIEGQKNGRFLCSKRFQNNFLPHTLGAIQKAVLKPRGYSNKFLLADFRHCEVSVLQWLSKDKELQSIIDSGKDLYREIYYILTKKECDSDKKRDMAKRMFLPVLYGAGAKTLGESLQITDVVAKELIRRIYASFPTCCRWLEQQQEKAAEDGKLVDYFGRPRLFSEKPYTARNFVVQGVAATVCLEKLVDLHRQLIKTPAKLCFSIHDGYGIIVPNDRIGEICTLVRKVLKAPSCLCPGLILDVEIKAGDHLDNLTVI